MIARWWDRVCLALSAGAVVVALGGGCRGALAPSADPVEVLAGASEVARGALELASLACPALPPAEREACETTGDGVSEMVLIADAVIDAREACALGDQECVAEVATLARARLPELRRVTSRLLVLIGGGGLAR